ncbi:MAG: HAD family hydrolase [Lachnospiraceae bacterium]|jgi:Cof subfamily protein (haloacid dehalogenase superfamily)|nr:HAD family hydrolase [Lachnospiraceae bacterium]
MRDDIPCRLICIDIDGTLLNDAKEVLPEVKKAVRRQHEKGRKIALVSGRMPCAVSQVEKQLETDCIKICNAGTFMIMNGVCVKEEVMSTRVMRQLYTDIAEKHHVPLWVFQGYKWYVTRIDSFVEKESDIIKYMPDVADLYELAENWDKAGVKPNKFLIAAKEEKTAEIQSELERWKDRAFDVARSSGNYLEIFPKNVDKGKAVASLCAILNIGTENAAAIGDHELDIPMIETAGIGIAMGNAIQELKEKADFVTLTNNEAGVAYALDHYCGF